MLLYLANHPQPTINITLFPKTCENLYLPLDCLKACQSVLTGNVRFLTFSFITTTLHDILNKKRYQHNTP